MYDLESITVAQCPAVCKLKDSDEEKDEECAENNLMVETDGSFAKIVSPRYDCGLQYRRKEICLYNVSLSCETNDVAVSARLSEINLSEGDFLDIIDYSHNHVYEKISGSQALSRDLRILNRQFVVLFSSSKKEKASGSGFNLHMECARKPNTNRGGENGEGSAETEEGSAETQQGSASFESN